MFLHSFLLSAALLAAVPALAQDPTARETTGRAVKFSAFIATGRATNATGQFEIADDRSPEEVAALIRRLGYEPVWKDWDAALTA